MSDTRKPLRTRILRWAQRTPVHTFVMCPLLVIAFELALNRCRLTVTPWGAPLLAWGYLQYLLVGNYRLPRSVYLRASDGCARCDPVSLGRGGRRGRAPGSKRARIEQRGEIR